MIHKEGLLKRPLHKEYLIHFMASADCRDGSSRTLLSARSFPIFNLYSCGMYNCGKLHISATLCKVRQHFHSALKIQEKVCRSLSVQI
jgi:hypothetical protein